MRWNDTVNVPSGTSAILYRPLLSVVVERRRSVRETCTSAIGSPDEVVTRPDTVPPVADISVSSIVRKCMVLSLHAQTSPSSEEASADYVSKCGRRGSATPLLRRAAEVRGNREE